VKCEVSSQSQRCIYAWIIKSRNVAKRQRKLQWLTPPKKPW